jgi:hypothetical protein
MPIDALPTTALHMLAGLAALLAGACAMTALKGRPLRGETGRRSIPAVLVLLLVTVLYWLARQVALRRRLRA